jgi:hypothetical protein
VKQNPGKVPVKSSLRYQAGACPPLDWVKEALLDEAAWKQLGDGLATIGKNLRGPFFPSVSLAFFPLILFKSRIEDPVVNKKCYRG